MSDYTRKPPGHEWCPPDPDYPAHQPNPPGCECETLPPTTPPILYEPAKCPEPGPYCKCPKPPISNPTCLEDLIARQAADLLLAANADALKKELEKLLGTAKAAALKYTRDAYDGFVKEWLKQDVLIAELIRKLVCTVPCWRCILDCYVCPLLNELHYAEKWLYDDGKQSREIYNLYDLQHWHKQDRDAKQRLFNRIEAVLKAWQDPFKTIGDALTANRALHEAASRVIGTEPGKAIYDVFLRLVPLHLAIAPPAGEGTTTKIDRKFTHFCPCDKGKPVPCCGPDVGELSLQQRLIGPQPYLIDPNEYFPLICCLVDKRYVPAKGALSKADTELANVTGKITRLEKQLADGLKADAFEKAAKAAIPSVIDCCEYENRYDDDTPPTSHQAR